MVPPWLRTAIVLAVPHDRANGRTRSGSRATFRTSHAAHFHRSAPSLPSRGSYSSRSLPVAEQDSEDREKNDAGGESDERRSLLGRGARGARCLAIGAERRGLVARDRRCDRSGGCAGCGITPGEAARGEGGHADRRADDRKCEPHTQKEIPNAHAQKKGARMVPSRERRSERALGRGAAAHELLLPVHRAVGRFD